jgi:hypothetical protein
MPKLSKTMKAKVEKKIAGPDSSAGIVALRRAGNTQRLNLGCSLEVGGAIGKMATWVNGLDHY